MRRDLGAVITALSAHGLTQGTPLTGISQGRLTEWVTGRRWPRPVHMRSLTQGFPSGID